jgi:hypothetical protein
MGCRGPGRPAAGGPRLFRRPPARPLTSRVRASACAAAAAATAAASAAAGGSAAARPRAQSAYSRRPQSQTS